ncbi:unnamed protein product [Protopolystoma xenopodis]|uniref:Integrin alpha-2 domain-containing protein n=1 Tax=Protopolystoma xenopodis TaxID=117903 RepID=A0A3S5CIY4_9PLAT|nr:unnamed protein product [Protopolystoma xenopodis]
MPTGQVVTTLSVDQGFFPPGVMPFHEPAARLHLSQTFFMPRIKAPLLHQIPIWPIIVGLVCGLILFALLVILLYRLGFFRRRRPAQLRAELTRNGARGQSDRPQSDQGLLDANASVASAPDGGRDSNSLGQLAAVGESGSAGRGSARGDEAGAGRRITHAGFGGRSDPKEVLRERKRKRRREMHIVHPGEAPGTTVQASNATASARPHSYSVEQHLLSEGRGSPTSL